MGLMSAVERVKEMMSGGMSGFSEESKEIVAGARMSEVVGFDEGKEEK